MHKEEYFMNMLYRDYCARVPVLEDWHRTKYLSEEKSATAPGNHPADFETLKPAEQDALLYWITQVIEPAKSYESQTSYSLKHNFEHEAFYITNGQFKGAMLSLGYVPRDEKALNWEFRIRQRVKRSTKTHRYYESLSLYKKYQLGKFDVTFAGLLFRAGHLTTDQLLKCAEDASWSIRSLDL
jgi:hypothetical protein